MDPRTLAHTLAFDDAPFARSHRGQVLVVGTAYAHLRMEGVLALHVLRDGDDATAAVAAAVARSKFGPSADVVLLQGITLAGFNVVDIHALANILSIPVVVVMRRPPRYEKVRRALLEHTTGGARKWAIVQRAGTPEPVAGVHVQRAGIELGLAGQLIAALTVAGRIPEPLRVAHLIAGGVTTGESRGRA
jgi:endonuclease V-like protein UPF0215 family